MTDYHTKTFYGQKSSITLTSPSKSAPYVFLSCINRKEDGSWENTSKGEGKTVKISTEEIICILEVLLKKSANWRGFHVRSLPTTEIFVGWEDESRQIIKIQIESYKKKLQFPNLNFFRLMLEHILSEKIEFATSIRKNELADEIYGLFVERITTRDGLAVVETTEYEVTGELAELEVKIKVESPKALLITLESDKEFWIPKSTIHNNYDVENKAKLQTLIVDKWIIEKQRIIK